MTTTSACYLEPSQSAAVAFFSHAPDAPVVMLNLLRFRAIADYSAHPDLAPPSPISGAQAYQRYIDHTTPFLAASGGELLLYGGASAFLIGPEDEHWDAAMLVRQRSKREFLAFASNAAYLAGIGHRSAALEDSRLLPLDVSLDAMRAG